MPSTRTISSNRRILLTGGSGLLGPPLIDTLLDQGADVVAITHRRPVDDRGGRVECLAGDIEKPRLGLALADYDRIRRSGVTGVIHAAAATNFQLGDKEVFGTNVTGTRRVIDFAADSGAVLNHVSSASALAGRYSSSPFQPTNYEQSKLLAEQLVAACGLPNVIYRLPVVLGDSRTGSVGAFQGMFQVTDLFLRGQLPVVPVGEEAVFDFLPQDIIASALAVSACGDVRGEVWLTAGNSAPRVAQVFRWMADFGRERLGIDVPSPRLVDPDRFDRLFRPVFLPKLPERMAGSLERILKLSRYFDVRSPFPSSLDDLRERFGLSPLPDLELAFRRSLDYWATARRKGGNRIDCGRAVG